MESEKQTTALSEGTEHSNTQTFTNIHIHSHTYTHTHTLLSLSSRLAPALSNNSTTREQPRRAAEINAVLPFYRKTNNNKIQQQKYNNNWYFSKPFQTKNTKGLYRGKWKIFDISHINFVVDVCSRIEQHFHNVDMPSTGSPNQCGVSKLIDAQTHTHTHYWQKRKEIRTRDLTQKWNFYKHKQREYVQKHISLKTELKRNYIIQFKAHHSPTHSPTHRIVSFIDAGSGSEQQLDYLSKTWTRSCHQSCVSSLTTWKMTRRKRNFQ